MAKRLDGSANCDRCGIWCEDADVVLQMVQGQVNARGPSLAFGNNRSMGATAFNELSMQSTKHQIQDVTDALSVLKRVKSKKWKFTDATNPHDDNWHYGPMLEDLPAEMHVTIGEGQKGYGLGDLLGLLWEAVRELVEEVERGKER